eukprot:scaffold41601_cov66-Cyclotella_meneghiniana.AAC.1
MLALGPGGAASEEGGWSISSYVLFPQILATMMTVVWGAMISRTLIFGSGSERPTTWQSSAGLSM